MTSKSIFQEVHVVTVSEVATCWTPFTFVSRVMPVSWLGGSCWLFANICSFVCEVALCGRTVTFVSQVIPISWLSRGFCYSSPFFFFFFFSWKILIILLALPRRILCCISSLIVCWLSQLCWSTVSLHFPYRFFPFLGKAKHRKSGFSLLPW